MQLEPSLIFHERYRLVSRLGGGAYGEVWLAEDTQLDLQVALKIYIALDDKGLDDFKSEFKNSFGLTHPNLLHAYHLDICENRPYLVMPYCGQSALSLVGHADEMTVWRFIRDVASGLEYLHQNGIVHRGIKPVNVLIDDEGTFLLSDFGISTEMRSTLRRNSTRQMNTSTLNESLPYMGPEMFASQPVSIYASDIWALGATLYEIVTGHVPAEGRGGVVLLDGGCLELPNTTFSTVLVDTIMSCLKKEPWDRPKAPQLAEKANAVLSGKLSIKENGFGKTKPIGAQGSPNTPPANEQDGKKTVVVTPDDRKEKNRTTLLLVLFGAVFAGALSYFLLPGPSSNDEQLVHDESVIVIDSVQESVVKPAKNDSLQSEQLAEVIAKVDARPSSDDDEQGKSVKEKEKEEKNSKDELKDNKKKKKDKDSSEVTDESQNDAGKKVKEKPSEEEDQDETYDESEDSDESVGSTITYYDKRMYPNGETYEGDMRNGQKNGHGVYKFADGRVYDGEWVSNKQSGKGKMTWSNGDKYDGDWSNGVRSGYGEFQYANGKEYIGNFKNNKYHGSGTLYYASNESVECYTGNWSEGKKSGQGTMKWRNGARYDGNWSNDNRHGQGVYTWSNGERYVGEFTNGKMTGNAKVYFANGNLKEEGYFIDGRRSK